LPVNSVPELIAYAKANPGKLNMGSVGIGGNPHVAGELFKIMSGIDMVHVPYRSAAAVLTDLLAGQVQVYFASSLSSKEYIKNGQLRALAITAATRTDLVPGVPALAEFLPGYEASPWCARQHARGNHRQAQCGDQQSSRRPKDSGEPRSPRRHADGGNARPVRNA